MTLRQFLKRVVIGFLLTDKESFEYCPVCGHANHISIKNVEHFSYVSECETVCKNETCKHEDCWAYGSYMYYSLNNNEVSSKFVRVLQWFKKLFK